MLCDVCGEAYPPHLMEVVDTLGICVDCLPDYMAERKLSDNQDNSQSGLPAISTRSRRFSNRSD